MTAPLPDRDFDLWTAPPDRSLQQFDRINAYARAERLPWRRIGSLPEELRAAESHRTPNGGKPFPLRRQAILPRRLFRRALSTRFEDDLVIASTSALAEKTPDTSAKRLLTTGQKVIATILVMTLACCFVLAPVATLIGANILATSYFLIVILFRLRLIAASFDYAKTKPGDCAVGALELPAITILLPLYKEAKSLEGLAKAIESLDYPEDKLDVKLLLEADDKETLQEARRLGLDRRFDCLAIPPSQPRTKPKACNHALYLARGELIVIYDAEDAPEPDQLRKAAAAFAESDNNLGCVQARLNYYNAFDNWLTGLFAVEYSLWFDSFLPALERFRIPIPLGGTSNFFRTQTLLEIGGWDPYNVTEDADIGFRLARRGYRTEMLASTTFEEANKSVRAWLRQRSRWMKGHMQTWLVHMRSANELRSVAGWRGVAANQFFVGGNFISALINPFLWAVFVWQLVSGSSAVAAFFPGPLLALNLFALLAGNCFFIYLGIIAPLRRGWIELSPYALLAPVYWWLSSLAAYRALWQLLVRPSYWEKTEHGLSPTSQRRSPGIFADKKNVA